MKTRMSWVLTALCCLLLLAVAPSIHGVTPDIRLPSWNKVEPKVAGWDGKGTLALELAVHAEKVRLLKLSASMIWPKPLESADRPEHLAALEAGKTWTTSWKAMGPDSFDGWLEIDLQGLPDSACLEREIAAIATLTAMTREVLTNEARGFKAAVQIGRTVPLHLDPGLAVFLPRHLVFSPVWVTNGRPLLLWQPAGLLGTGQVSEAWNAFCQAIPAQNAKAALSALASLQKLLGNATEPVPLRGADQGEYALAPRAILEAIAVNLATLRAAEKPAGDTAGLARLLEKGEPSFSRPFALANLGILHLLGNRPGLAL